MDAAVGVGFALAVTLPRAGNLGGGGFMLVHWGASGETVAIDYRETARLPPQPICFSTLTVTSIKLAPVSAITPSEFRVRWPVWPWR